MTPSPKINKNIIVLDDNSPKTNDNELNIDHPEPKNHENTALQQENTLKDVDYIN